MQAAKAKFIGLESNYSGKFTHGKIYDAYFLEFWQGERKSLHVRGNDGKISDFNSIDDFEIIEDRDNVLNNYEAIVRCINHKFDDQLFDLNFGKEYRTIGIIDSDTMGFCYLVMDESYDCYFYSPEFFEIVADPYNLLDRENGQHVYMWE